MSPRKKSTATVSTAVLAYAERQVQAKPEPDPIVERAVTVHATPCALEAAPVGAKCVVSRTDEGKKVRLLTPAGTTELGKDDIFYTLPAGAKVRKAAEGTYEAYRLGVQHGPLFVAHSARDAVTLFLQSVT